MEYKGRTNELFGMSQPRISVVMPVYSGALPVREAIQRIIVPVLLIWNSVSSMTSQQMIQVLGDVIPTRLVDAMINWSGIKLNLAILSGMCRTSSLKNSTTHVYTIHQSICNNNLFV